MIYFDNAATSLKRPDQVVDAMTNGLDKLGNPGRSFHSPALEAARAVYSARKAVADLAGGADPLQVAFTSGATESLNLAIYSLLRPQDHVITTVLEHNSVLRPLYRLGCGLSFITCDGQGRLCLEDLPGLLRHNTRAVVCTHGSNLLGSVTDLPALREFCQSRGLLLILDVAQTLGSLPVEAQAADVLCFTGHKGLMGPQGTGGIIARPGVDFKLVKTGGSGSHSFEPHQVLEMPDILEAGTPNTHGLAGLKAGADFILSTGLDAIAQKEQALTTRFLEGLAGIPGIRLFGPGEAAVRLPVVALNLGDMPSDQLAIELWEGWEIATRPGSHCAPLVHERFGTKSQGMVRFSFGWFNTEGEIDTALSALKTISQRGGHK